MNSFFEELFRYNQHCNQQLVEIFDREYTKVDTKSVALFSHILNAHHIWNNRILERKTDYGVWDSHAIDAFAAIDWLNHDGTRHILTTCDLANNIAYQTTLPENHSSIRFATPYSMSSTTPPTTAGS